MTFDVVVDSQFLELIDGEEFSGGSNNNIKSHFIEPLVSFL
jgi:hypothetical protein